MVNLIRPLSKHRLPRQPWDHLVPIISFRGETVLSGRSIAIWIKIHGVAIVKVREKFFLKFRFWFKNIHFIFRNFNTVTVKELRTHK